MRFVLRNVYLIELTYQMSISVLRRSFIYSFIVSRVWHCFTQQRKRKNNFNCGNRPLQYNLVTHRIIHSAVWHFSNWIATNRMSRNPPHPTNHELKRSAENELRKCRWQATTQRAMIFRINLKTLKWCPTSPSQSLQIGKTVYDNCGVEMFCWTHRDIRLESVFSVVSFHFISIIYLQFDLSGENEIYRWCEWKRSSEKQRSHANYMFHCVKW